MFRKITAFLVLVGLVFSGLFAITAPASATGSGTDATLSGISLFSSNTGRNQAVIGPEFRSEQVYYEAFSALQDVEFTITATDPTASIRVTGGDQNNALFSSGTGRTISFPPTANNLVSIVVTSGNGSTTKTYKVNLSATVVPQPELVSFAPSNFSTAGGTTGVAYIKHYFNNAWNNDGSCYGDLRLYQKYQYDGSTYVQNSGIDEDVIAPDENGIVRVTFTSNASYRYRDISEKADLRVINNCWMADPIGYDWYNPRAETRLPGAITWFNPSVSSTDLGDSITQMQIFKISGPGITDDAWFDVYLLNPVTGSRMWLQTKHIDSNNMFVWAEPQWWMASDWFAPARVKLVVEQYDDEGSGDAVVLYSKDLNYTPETPSQVSITPPKGPISGGNVVRLSGHHLCVYPLESLPRVTIGGQAVSLGGGNIVSGCNWDSWYQTSDGKNFDGLDKFWFVVPPGISAGAVDITVDIGFGPVKLAQKYVYGAKPTVSAISPRVVSNSGGSTVTITGDNFGTSGTPTVTIDGIKSPFVQRISNSKILALVPATTSVGDVDVNVISSSGGGALDTPSTLTLAAPSANPTVSSITPDNAGVAGGETITITGTGFSTTASGVTIGGVPAVITSATATTLTVEAPTVDVAGQADLVVGTPTGIVTKLNFFNFTVTPGVTSVNPSAIKSTDTGNAAKVTITGNGFGKSGTLSVGGGKAVTYSSNGTTISGVVIPTSKVGPVSVSITPAGAKIPFTTSVQVNGPTITYVGSDPFSRYFGVGTFLNSDAYVPAVSSSAGGEKLLIRGSSFGSSGKVKVGNKVVTPTSYSDTEIAFTAPAISTGTYAVTVVPSTGTVTATRAGALVVGDVFTNPTITSVQSANPNTRNADRKTFDKIVDTSDLFTITGSGFRSTDAGASTKVLMQLVNDDSNGDWVSITPTSITDTVITFRAPKTFPVLNWTKVRVQTKTRFAQVDFAIYYVGVPPQPTTMNPGSGLCTNTSMDGYSPAVVTATGPSVFGNSGTVSIDSTVLNAGAVSWSDSSVVVSFANLTTNLANPWGPKQITFTPSDSSLPAQTFAFDCRVVGTVTTKLNGSTNDLTISAGTSYTPSAAWATSLSNTTYVQNANGYYYQSAADYNARARVQNVKSGLPVAAGEWYIWANTGAATWDSGKYLRVDAANVVRLVITGNPVTFTPKLSSGTGTTIVYRGQLGDGTNSSRDDISYTKTSTADAVTSVTWQYRNHQCALANPNYGWTSGLPSGVAIATSTCGGDDVSVTSWDIRVASFQMLSGGVDKSIYYLPTFNTFNLTITKKDLTVTAVKAEKAYDGTTSVTLGEITVNGAIDGDQPTLDPSFAAGAAFADPNVGASKPITLNGPFKLSAGSATNYNLANPNLVVTGRITKADAIVKLTAATQSVILGATPTIAVSVAVTDARTGQALNPAANAPDPVMVSTTPSICTLSGTTVTPVRAGDCVIRATQASSTNYNAALSYRDNTVTQEELVIKIYPTPKVISVVADDVQVAVGDAIGTSYSMIGLIDGDTFDNVNFAFYQGSTLLNTAPTAVGTYKIVPLGGNLNAVDALAYNNAVKYIAGKLVITPAPPVISASSPAHGPEAGGNTLVITGTGLGAVTSITIGDLKIRKPKFVVNGTGTSISLKMPKGVGGVSVTLNAGSSSVSTDYTYDPPPVVNAPLSIDLNLDLRAGVKLEGQKVEVSGGGLKPNSSYTLTMHSKPIVIYTGVTDSAGNFKQTLVIPAKACLAAGRHNLTLEGTSPAGKSVTSIGHFSLDDQCRVTGQAVQNPKTKSWTLSGFLFDYRSPKLNAGGLKSLNELSKLIKGAKTVTLYGYTETDTKSAAIKRANIILAKGRCDSVVVYLKKLGIKAKFVTVAKGGVDPVSLKNQAQNRRVVIQATY